MQLDDAKARIGQLEAELTASRATIGQLEAEVLALRAQVDVLLVELGRNSTNSNLPPSSDPPGKPKDEDKDKPKKGERKRKRKRGGQKGHRGHHRKLLPPERVTEVIYLFPTHCDKCCKPLPQIQCSDPKRSQSIELPPVEPHVTEYRRHEVECHDCEHHTLAPYDADVIPASSFGPRLTAAIGLLTGVYHLSRRTAREMLGDLMGVKISLGGLSGVEALSASLLEVASRAALRKWVLGWRRSRDDDRIRPPAARRLRLSPIDRDVRDVRELASIAADRQVADYLAASAGQLSTSQPQLASACLRQRPVGPATVTPSAHRLFGIPSAGPQASTAHSSAPGPGVTGLGVTGLGAGFGSHPAPTKVKTMTNEQMRFCIPTR